MKMFFNATEYGIQVIALQKENCRHNCRNAVQGFQTLNTQVARVNIGVDHLVGQQGRKKPDHTENEYPTRVRSSQFVHLCPVSSPVVRSIRIASPDISEFKFIQIPSGTLEFTQLHSVPQHILSAPLRPIQNHSDLHRFAQTHSG